MKDSIENPTAEGAEKSERRRQPVGLYFGEQVLGQLGVHANPDEVSKYLATVITAVKHAGINADKVATEMLKGLPLTEEGNRQKHLSEAAAHGNSGLDFDSSLMADVGVNGADGPDKSEDIRRSLAMTKELVDIFASEKKRDPMAGAAVLKTLRAIVRNGAY